ncbi:site-specific integrase [Flavobacterium hydatis]|uniref:Tyrosine type site-specific recombinase n=1 Tax=Flavobacterium hydatis TaxID=991 RepID=A0A086AAM0_FLAHY|nr:site-specific integrase [Flavobacterium hydatis]KFF13734.1 tyrosine type site-specific recombinase [Flavobacterium hydatis]OXA97772.1 tyrosine type site-specific recombinase [Flavobacterium hydatis]
MLKVIFYLKAGKFNKNGESPIYARISFKKQSSTMAVGKSILKERWQFTDNLRSVLKLEKEKVIKNALDLFLLNMEKKFNELLKIDSDFSLQLLKDEFKGESTTKVNDISIVEIMERHNEFFQRKVDAGERSIASHQKYERAKDLLVSFMTKQYGMTDMSLNDVTNSYVYNLESFLKYDSHFKGKTGIQNNSVVKYIRMYKTACKYSVRMGLIDKDPFSVYDGKIYVTDAIFLTQEELDRIESKNFSIKRLERVKDVFLFSCYTGYAPVDAANLTSNNISEDSYGNLWIITNRAKTTIRANVPVLAPTQTIINKYRNLQIGLIPQISNQKMNAYLKEIADLCDIDKHLTWYVARHTFATTVTLGNGVRIENVSAMMGHTNIKQTQHYAKVLDVNVMEDMSKLKQKYS